MVLGLESLDKRLSTVLKEVLASINEFDRKIHFDLMNTRKYTYRV